MDIVEIRRENLRRWVEQYGTPAKEKSLFSQLKANGSFGERVARRLEEQYKMGAGYLDRAPGAASIHATTVELEDAPPIVQSLRLIPIVGRVQAGSDGLLHIDDYSVEHPDGHLLWYAPCKEAYALRIRGESMSPRYLPGEFVGVDPCGEAQPSDEVIVKLKDGGRMIKRLLWIRDGQACFESVNKDHANIILDCAEIDGMDLVLGHIPKSAFKQSV